MGNTQGSSTKLGGICADTGVYSLALTLGVWVGTGADQLAYAHSFSSFGCRYDADVNMADRWNGTPLTAALRHGHLAIAKMLMSCEAKLGDNANPALAQVSLNSWCTVSPRYLSSC